MARFGVDCLRFQVDGRVPGGVAESIYECVAQRDDADRVHELLFISHDFGNFDLPAPQRRRRGSLASDPAGPAAMRAFWTVMTASIIGYSIGYLISIFFPIEAPFFAMRGFHLPPLAGGAATGLINFIEGWGRVRGGAFPSAHVSGSFVALIGAWRYRRYLFWVFLPFFIGMCISTIYGRYHYIADVFAGMIVGAAGFFLAERLMRVRGANPAREVVVKKIERAAA